MPAVTIGGVVFAATADFSGGQWVEQCSVEAKNKRKRKIAPPGVDGSGLKIGGFKGRTIFVVATVAAEEPGFTLLDALANSFSVVVGDTTYENCTLVTAQILSEGQAVYSGGVVHLTTVQIICEQFAE